MPAKRVVVGPAPLIPDNPEARFAHQLRQTAERRPSVPHSELVRELLELSRDNAPIAIVHYDGRREEGRLHQITTNDTGEIIMILRPHRERQRGGHLKVVKHQRPIIFAETHVEYSRTKGRLTIGLSSDGANNEYGFTIKINTIHGSDRVE